ncbi:MAG: NAD(P)/FAD-dependent oxidoreductase [Chitinophagales bacterium]
MRYSISDTSLPHIVVVGGGFAGLAAIKKLNNKPFRVTLLDKHNYHTFQPLLYQVASGGLSADSIAYPFRRKTGAYPNIRFRMCSVESVDLENKKVITDRGAFAYDILIIAAGAQTNYYGNAQLEKFGLPLKSVPDALNLRSFIFQEFEEALLEAREADIKKRMHFVIAGGGPTGVELAGALAEIRKKVLPNDYRELLAQHMEVTLIEGNARLLSGMREKSGNLAKKYLEKLGVQVMLKTMVKNYDGSTLQVDGRDDILTDNVIWTAGVQGVQLAGIDAAAYGRGKRLLVDAYNRLQGREDVYVLGDLALMHADSNYPEGHPGVAQVAIQQAHHVVSNLLRSRKQLSMRPFHYKNKGSMATIGRHRAVVDLPRISFGGFIAWYIWMVIHLMTLVGFRNKFIVFVNWMWNYITYDRALRLIIRPFRTKTGDA